MDQPTPDTIAGVKYATLVASFFGSTLSIAYAKPATRTQAVLGFITGVAVAFYSTPMAMHYLDVPPQLERGVAFLVGFAAYRAVPGFLALVDKLRDIKLPFTG